MQEKLDIMTNEINTLKMNLSKYFNNDQIDSLKRIGNNYKKWSIETCEKAIDLRYKIGLSGYEIIRKFVPIPSMTTLFRRLENFDFITGVCNVAIEYLKYVCAENPIFSRGCLVLDRMSLVPGEDFDKNGNKLGFDTLKNNKNILASDGLAVLFCGTIRRFKQIVGHHYTEKSVNGEDLKTFILEIIHAMWTQSKIWVDAIICDLGPENTSMLKAFGLSISMTNVDISIVHPCDSGKRLFFIADAVHDFKNISCQFRSKEKIEIPQKFVEAYNLSSNCAKFLEVRKLFNAQKKMTYQPAQKLTETVLHPDQWEKMRVKNHTKLFDSDVVAALSYIFEQDSDDVEIFLMNDMEYMSDMKVNPTAWIMNKIREWINIMKSRSTTRFPLQDENKYEEFINSLKEFVDIFEKIKIGDKKLPSLSGAAKATRALIELSSIYKADGISHIVPGWFTQDSIENLFSIIRSVRALPSCKQFSQQLKSQIVSRYTNHSVKGSSYDFEDDFEENTELSFLNFIKDINHPGTDHLQDSLSIDMQQEILSLKEDNSFNVEIDIENFELFENELEQCTFFYVVGYLIKRCLKKVSCADCHFMLTDNAGIPTKLNRLWRLKKQFGDFTPIEPSGTAFHFHLKLEKVFKAFFGLDLNIENEKFREEFHAFVSTAIVFDFEHCKCTTDMLIKNFISFRLYITREKRNIHKRNKFSSKSMK